MSTTPSTLERAVARHLVEKNLRVKPGENVIVEAWDHTLSMSTAMVDAVRRIGGRAFLAYENDDAWWRAVQRGQADLIGRLSGPEWAALRAADVYVPFWGPSDSARLFRLPEKRLDAWATGWFDQWYKTARSTGLRGGRMAVGWVTDSRARKWGVRKERWKRELLEACMVDPSEMTESGTRLARALKGTKRLRITHRNGTDVEVALAGVPPRVYDGLPHPGNKTYSEFDMMANFPDGRLRVALDAKTAEGAIVSSYRSYEQVWFPWATHGGGRFEFSEGKLTSFSFDEGGAEFAKRYARGKPGKNRTGTLSIGLNPRVEDVPYLEDRERGCVQLAVGGNAFLGGSNTSDFTGWVSLAGSEISIEGVPIVRSGRIL